MRPPFLLLKRLAGSVAPALAAIWTSGSRFLVGIVVEVVDCAIPPPAREHVKNVCADSRPDYEPPMILGEFRASLLFSCCRLFGVPARSAFQYLFALRMEVSAEMEAEVDEAAEDPEVSAGYKLRCWMRNRRPRAWLSFDLQGDATRNTNRVKELS